MMINLDPIYDSKLSFDEEHNIYQINIRYYYQNKKIEYAVVDVFIAVLENGKPKKILVLR